MKDMKTTEKVKRGVTHLNNGVKLIQKMTNSILTKVINLMGSLHQSMTRRQRVVAGSIAIIVVGMVIFTLSLHTAKKALPKEPSQPLHALHFQQSGASRTSSAFVMHKRLADQSEARMMPDQIPPSVEATPIITPDNKQLSGIKAQLNDIKNSLSGMASQQAIVQLQTQLAEVSQQANPELLGKVNQLQGTMKTLIKQTASVQYVNPKTVEKYFRLVAVQGFSDGMKAIIDVNSNQMALSPNAVCPACRGWTLKSLDFTNQIAVFENTQHQRVKLTASY